MYKRCRLTWNFYLFPPSSNQKQFHLWNDAIRRNGPIVYRPVIITLLFFLFFSNKKTQGTPRPERAHTLSFKRYIPAPPSSLISSTEKIHSHKSFLFFSYFFCTRGETKSRDCPDGPIGSIWISSINQFDPKGGN